MSHKFVNLCGVVTVTICGYLWALNAYKLSWCDFLAPYKCEAIRAAGVVFPPLGIVYGLAEVKDGEQ